MIDSVQTSLTATRKEAQSAEAFYARNPSSSESVDAIKRLTALGAAINKCEESLALSRIVAVGSDAVDLANAGDESAGNAVELSVDEPTRAIASAKDAQGKLSRAEAEFQTLAAQYPGAGFGSDIAYCQEDIKAADLTVKFVKAMKGTDMDAIDKAAKAGDKQDAKVAKMTNPVDRWNKVSTDNMTVYNQAIDTLAALERGTTP
ncbi:MAG: hypothetical protein WCJ13_03920 [Coriobacteriia bacterium]